MSPLTFQMALIHSVSGGCVLHLWPSDAMCHGDWDPHNMVCGIVCTDF